VVHGAPRKSFCSGASGFHKGSEVYETKECCLWSVLTDLLSLQSTPTAPQKRVRFLFGQYKHNAFSTGAEELVKASRWARPSPSNRRAVRRRTHFSTASTVLLLHSPPLSRSTSTTRRLPSNSFGIVTIPTAFGLLLVNLVRQLLTLKVCVVTFTS